MDIITDLAVFDCYFAFYGNPIESGQIQYEQITSNNLSAHVKFFNVQNTDPISVTMSVVNDDGTIVKEQTTTVDQNPFLYNTNERADIEFVISRSELQPFIVYNYANLFIELYANGSIKPFFATKWDGYAGIAKVDSTTKPAYTFYDSYRVIGPRA